MASAKAWFGEALGRFFFRKATVSAVRETSAKLRLVEMAGEELRGVSWTPGDKVQVFLGDAGMRTYTPLRWDATAGETSFLCYVHGEASGGGAPASPGARWARDLAPGATCQLFGPRGSIAFPSFAADDVTLFGDETSFAAASALQALRPRARFVFEVDDEEDARTALEALKLSADVIPRAPNDAHVGAIAEMLQKRPPESLVFTGRAQTIQALRGRGLRAAKTKAYWSVGKVGLD